MTRDERAATSQPPLVNRVMARLLRSPLSRLVDRGVMLLTVNGQRTGYVYTFPVQYVEDGTVLWVYVGEDAVKTWWRNLLGGAKVQVLLRRSIHTGTAVALRQAASSLPRRAASTTPATSASRATGYTDSGSPAATWKLTPSAASVCP